MPKIRALVKVFHKYIKAFLAPKIRKSVLKELAFIKSDFLGLANFGFLDLANFVAVDRFSKLVPILPPSGLVVPRGIS